MRSCVIIDLRASFHLIFGHIEVLINVAVKHIKTPAIIKLSLVIKKIKKSFDRVKHFITICKIVAYTLGKQKTIFCEHKNFEIRIYMDFERIAIRPVFARSRHWQTSFANHL